MTPLTPISTGFDMSSYNAMGTVAPSPNPFDLPGRAQARPFFFRVEGGQRRADRGSDSA